MIYLSQLKLNPRSRMVQRELTSPYQLHRTLLQAFATDRQTSHVLHRAEYNHRGSQPVILVQSTKSPDWSQLRDAYLLGAATKPIDVQLSSGQSYRFRLRASPTIAKRRRDAQGNRRNSNRVPLVREEKQLAWLSRRADQHGFRLLHVQVSNPLRQHDRRKKITVFSVQFDGLLQVADAEAFNSAWRTGIGPSKAFGCGLLSLAPA